MIVIGRVYKITNLIDGKIYIGATVKPLYSRWLAHISTAYGKNKKKSIISLMILKDGFENFKIEKIKTCFSIEHLHRSEIYFIKYFNTLDPNIGYNVAEGGKHIISKLPNKKQRAIQKRSLKAELGLGICIYKLFNKTVLYTYSSYEDAAKSVNGSIAAMRRLKSDNNITYKGFDWSIVIAK